MLAVAVAIVTAGATAAAVIWRRRRSGYVAPAVQFGLGDGAIHTLDETDASVAELRELASAVRLALEAA